MSLRDELKKENQIINQFACRVYEFSHEAVRELAERIPASSEEEKSKKIGSIVIVGMVRAAAAMIAYLGSPYLSGGAEEEQRFMVELGENMNDVVDRIWGEKISPITRIELSEEPPDEGAFGQRG
jgi:hypothetical protein